MGSGGLFSPVQGRLEAEKGHRQGTQGRLPAVCYARQSRMHKFVGGAFASWFKYFFNLKKGTPKELRGACLLRVARQ